MVTVEQAQQELNIKKIACGSVSWLDVEMPTLAEMEYLRTTFDFHTLALDDCLSRVQLPKMDDYDDYLFLVLHFPLFNQEARLTVPSQVSIFVSGDYLVTVHRGDLRPLMKLFADCEASEPVRKNVMGHSSGYLLYQVLDGLVDYCFPSLNKVIERVDDLEVRVFDMAAKDLARELLVTKRDILAYRRIVRPQIEVLELLEKKEYPFLKVDPDVYFGDLADHMRRISVELEDLKEVIQGLHDTHVSLTTDRTNEVIRTLTIIATIMLPLSVLSGLYGMNVSLPFDSSPYAFLVVLGVMAIVAGGMLLFFRSRRWF
ncbi:MAG: magnesium transporter CorA family protein [Dehalococcoidia bacterium]|nr:magnesium transporter CorA family protein [Dehalococcoidia bacterium]